jgi:uncharacterized C2H2 Zn-finger protein
VQYQLYLWIKSFGTIEVSKRCLKQTMAYSTGPDQIGGLLGMSSPVSMSFVSGDSSSAMMICLSPPQMGDLPMLAVSPMGPSAPPTSPAPPSAPFPIFNTASAMTSSLASPPPYSVPAASAAVGSVLAASASSVLVLGPPLPIATAAQTPLSPLQWPADIKNDVKQKGITKSFPCPHCDRTFDRSYNMNRHVQTFHEKQRPFACTQCDRAFQLKHHLDTHVNATHNKIIVATCAVCKKGFCDRSNYQRHLNSHNRQTNPMVTDEEAQ